jgi:hypothetical protein
MGYTPTYRRATAPFGWSLVAACVFLAVWFGYVVVTATLGALVAADWGWLWKAPLLGALAGLVGLVGYALEVAFGLLLYVGAMLLAPASLPARRLVAVMLAPLTIALLLPLEEISDLGGHLLFGALLFGCVVPLPEHLGAEPASAHSGQRAESQA